MSEAVNNGRLYKGEVQPAQGEKDSKTGQPLYPYLPDDDLIEAVNLAIILKRPLLIRGEPGTGKTRLARAVAYELKYPYLEWHIKSSSRALDGCYTYDNVARLRDAQLASAQHLTEKELAEIRRRVAEPGSYVRWGPLGQAFRSDEPTVLLIDEIDKADIDFPNDLLLELDEWRFKVEETGEIVRVTEGAEPIIFITSNDEKELPDAFLRRCLFHYIEFPKESKRLAEIVKLHFRDASDDLVNRAVERFRDLRNKMIANKGDIGKKASTSELLDWFKVLTLCPHEEALQKVEGKLPASLLLKSWDDHIRYMDS
jgi:MoxR-like ATPase